MENIAVAKTLLSVWQSLGAYETMLADRAQNHALCSFSSPLLTNRIVDKIIDLNVKRQSIHTLRVGLDRLLSRLDRLTQQIVRAHYQPFATTHDIAAVTARLGIAERSYFRRLANATHYVANHLSQLGINFFSWQALLQTHGWIREAWLSNATRRR